MIDTHFSSQESVERWLGRFCRELRLPAVRMEFLPQGRSSSEPRQYRIDPPADIKSPVRARDERFEVAWMSEVRAGNRRFGQLQIRVIPAHFREADLLQACGMADQLTRLAADYGHLLQALAIPPVAEKLSRADLTPDALPELVAATLQSLLRLTTFRGAALFLLNPGGRGLQLKHYLHRSLAALPTAERELITADYDRQALLEEISVCRWGSAGAEDCLPEGVRTGVCVRIAHADGVIGTLWAYDRRRRTVDERDRHVLQSVAAQLAVMFDQAVTAVTCAQHRRLKTELRLASVTQPAKTVQFGPDHHGFEAYGKCLSQFDVGGDLCEVIPLDSDTILIVVGDASGNSIPAALVMTAVRGAIHAIVAEPGPDVLARFGPGGELEPARLMRRLNQMLVRLTASHQFMSCVCGLFHLPSRQFTFCNAGHPMPLLLNSEAVEYLPSHGLLLGIDGAVCYQQETRSFAPGDVFVFYTDGISEALSQGKRLFRQDGIANASRAHFHDSAAAITTAIWNRMLAHRAGAGESDDATILTVRPLGTA